MVAAEGGAERFRSLVEAAVELPVFQVGLVLDRTEMSSPAERDRALAEVAPILAAMGEGASRSDLVRVVAERLELEPALVMGRLTAAQPLSGGTQPDPDPRAAAPQRPRGELTSRERRERSLLAMCIALPEEGRGYLARLERGPPLEVRSPGRRLARRQPRGPGVEPAARRRRARRADRRAGDRRQRRARLGGVDGAQLHAARAGPARGRDRRRRRRRGSRAPGRAQPRAGGARRADRPGRAGRELTGKFSGPFRGSSIRQSTRLLTEGLWVRVPPPELARGPAPRRARRRARRRRGRGPRPRARRRGP